MLVVGIILLLATNSEYCLSNITGLAMMYTAGHKLNIFMPESQIIKVIPRPLKDGSTNYTIETVVEDWGKNNIVLTHEEAIKLRNKLDEILTIENESMNKVKIEVSKGAAGWIERFQYKNDADKERIAIQRIISYVIVNWVGEFISDTEAKDMLITLSNADNIIKSLGE